ncbi:MAG: hypothetical protein P4K97_09845 [Terracidiphilus sp.]|nr:hypothetical protein [Terracidiphilus sp.]
MKILSTLLALTALCAPLSPAAYAQATPAPAQAQSDVPACEGAYNILRISEITPTGSMEKFMAAVAAHQAWYTSHGYADIVFAARIAERDPQTKTFAYSDKLVMTYHYSKGPGPNGAHDAAWDAYVKMYNETSTIKESHLNCVPEAGLPASLK